MTNRHSNTETASTGPTPGKAGPADTGGLTHLTAAGEAQMVDVGAKPLTRRTAKAQALVTMQPETARQILAGDLPKGDVLGTARLAGIMAAKRTHELIPLCHPLPLDSIDVQIDFRSPTQARIVATVRATWRTGVEMEALTAVSVAALTLYDMSKAVDKGMIIGPIGLISKTGGKSGDFQANAPDLTPEQEE